MRFPWQRPAAKKTRSAPGRLGQTPTKFLPQLEPLEQRQMPSATVLDVTTNADIGGMPSGGSLTLRQAINVANTDTPHNPAGYLIQLQSNTIYQITLPNSGGVSEDQNVSGDFDIRTTLPVTILGGASGGTVVEGFSGGSSPDRVFDVGPKGKVTFQGLTIEGGNTTSDGGGLRTAPGSIVKLTNDIVQDNTAGGNGGGIAAGYFGFGGSSGGQGGSLTLTDSLIQSCSGGLGSGGSQGHGGGIASTNQILVIHHTQIRDNTIGFSGGSLEGLGGGVYADDPSRLFRHGTNVVIDQNSTISKNQAFGSATSSGGGGQGGGIFILREDTTRISDSLIGGPSGGNDAQASPVSGGAGGAGGGITALFGTLILDNTIVQENLAEGNEQPSGTSGFGGGIAVAFENFQVTNHSSILQNTAAAAGGQGAAGGGIFAESSMVRLTNSTIGGSGGSDGNLAAGSLSGGGGFGGGIFAVNLGTTSVSLILTNSVVSNNRAGAVSGGGGGEGGGIFAARESFGQQNVHITGSEISDNIAEGGLEGGAGGGIALSAVHARLSGGTVHDNIAQGGLSGGVGGGFFLDGNGSTLDVSGQALITHNTAAGGSGGALGGAGGGIYMLGSASGGRDTLNLKDSTVSANMAQASDTEGGSGGGIFSNGGIVKLTNATIGGPTFGDGNTAESSSGGSGGVGGGIFASHLPGESTGPAPLSITRSSISHNTAGDTASGGSGKGGGLALTDVGRATIFASTFDHNQALGTSGGSASGGGIFTGGSVSGGTNLSITNSTISENLAAAGSGGGSGGGLYAHSFDTIKLLNDTIAFNQAGEGGGGITRASGGGSASMSVFVENTIVAKNTLLTSPTESDLDGLFTSLGHNLIGFGPPGGGFTNGKMGDKVGTDAANPLDPGLDPNLADNGGPTLTHALLPGSIAIDAADSHAPKTDQRGVIRVIPDIGAYEVPEPVPSSTPPASGSVDLGDQ